VRDLRCSAARRGAPVRGRVARRRGSRSSPRAATAAATSCSWGTCRRSMALGPSKLGVRELEAILEQGGVRELILATNSTVEGEATAHFLSELAVRRGIRASRIAPRRAGRGRARVRRRRNAGARAFAGRQSDQLAPALRPARRAQILAQPAQTAGSSRSGAHAGHRSRRPRAPRIRARAGGGNRRNGTPGARRSTSRKPRVRSSSAAAAGAKSRTPGESIRAAAFGRSNRCEAVVV